MLPQTLLNTRAPFFFFLHGQAWHPTKPLQNLLTSILHPYPPDLILSIPPSLICFLSVSELSKNSSPSSISLSSFLVLNGYLIDGLRCLWIRMRVKKIHPLCSISLESPGIGDQSPEVSRAVTTASSGGSDGNAGRQVGSDINIAGVLYKWTNYGKGWRFWWFLLRSGVLSYSQIRQSKSLHLPLPADDIRVIGDVSTNRLSRLDSGGGRRKHQKNVGSFWAGHFWSLDQAENGARSTERSSSSGSTACWSADWTTICTYEIGYQSYSS